jgi:hypothetical protein
VFFYASGYLIAPRQYSGCTCFVTGVPTIDCISRHIRTHDLFPAIVCTVIDYEQLIIFYVLRQSVHGPSFHDIRPVPNRHEKIEYILYHQFKNLNSGRGMFAIFHQKDIGIFYQRFLIVAKKTQAETRRKNVKKFFSLSNALVFREKLFQ